MRAAGARLTAGELREAMAGVPDDAEIAVEPVDDCVGVIAAETTPAGPVVLTLDIDNDEWLRTDKAARALAVVEQIAAEKMTKARILELVSEWAE